jgi:hypothetical protein
MDFGFVTHAVHANSRLVYLPAELAEDGQTLTVTGPPHGGVYPPGPGWLCVITGDVPSTAMKTMVGDGQGPPVDHGAIERWEMNLFSRSRSLIPVLVCSLLKSTKGDQGD